MAQGPALQSHHRWLALKLHLVNNFVASRIALLLLYAPLKQRLNKYWRFA